MEIGGGRGYGASAMLGIFDSGVGGLAVLQAVRRVLPHHAILYLGDNARAPYGDRPRDVVTRYTKECCAFLFARGCTFIVLACNTVSADTLRELQQIWLPTLGQRTKDLGQRTLRPMSYVPCPRNILGVIRPLAEEAVLQTKTERIGVLATRSTVASEAYIQELRKLRPQCTTFQQACPLLVPLIEEGWAEKPETRRVLRSYLRPMKTWNPDVLILGCTHYEVLHPVIARMMGRRCTVLHSPSIVAGKLQEYLGRHPEYDSTIPRTNETTFLTTGDPVQFTEVGSRFFGRELWGVERVEVPSLPGASA